MIGSIEKERQPQLHGNVKISHYISDKLHGKLHEPLRMVHVHFNVLGICAQNVKFVYCSLISSDDKISFNEIKLSVHMGNMM